MLVIALRELANHAFFINHTRVKSTHLMASLAPQPNINLENRIHIRKPDSHAFVAVALTSMLGTLDCSPLVFTVDCLKEINSIPSSPRAPSTCTCE